MRKISFIWSKRFLTVLAAVTGLAWLSSWPFPITVGLVMLVGFTYPAAVRPLLRYKFWLAIGLLVILVPLFAGTQDQQLLWFDYSSVKLAQTTIMALRGIIVFLLIQIMTVDLDTEKFTGRLKRYGSENFVTLYHISREIVPSARQILNKWLSRVKSGSLKDIRPATILSAFTSIFFELISLAENLNKNSGEFAVKNPRLIADELHVKNRPLLLLVTGEPGAGKTSWLQELAAVLTEKQISFGGVITCRKHNSEGSWDLEIQNISGNSQRLLAARDKQEGWIKTKNYYIDPDAFTWGCRQLDKSDGEWLVVDEVGIFEFNRDGFYPALLKISAGFRGILVMSLRKSLFPELDKFLADNLPGLLSWQRKTLIIDD